MYEEMEPAVAEIKRLYVGPPGRGHGLGRPLLSKMFQNMADDGYKIVRFSSARFLTHARRLYTSVGFVDIPQPESLPEFLKDIVYFMERPSNRLASSAIGMAAEAALILVEGQKKGPAE